MKLVLECEEIMHVLQVCTHSASSSRKHFLMLAVWDHFVGPEGTGERYMKSMCWCPTPVQHNSTLTLDGLLFPGKSPVLHITPHINQNSTKLCILFKGLGRALVTLWARYLHAHKQNPDKNRNEVSLKILHNMKFTLLL